MHPALDVLAAFARLGVTSFGGPVAHIGYFRREFVERRAWLDEARFAEIVALAQALPGAASSKVGLVIGFVRAGWLGMLAAWIAFTLPSAIALTLFAYYVRGGADFTTRGWVHGLLLAAVVVVAHAVWNMRTALAPDLARSLIALGAATLALLFPTAFTQVALIGAGALVGRFLFAHTAIDAGPPLGIRVNARIGWIALSFFFAILLVVPLVRAATHNEGLALFDAFFRTGAFVFGGGHVVLPLLETAVVEPGWVARTDFVAGYGAAQAIPGPLFTFSAFLGAVNHGSVSGWSGAAIALAAIFLPSALLTAAVLPFWDRVRATTAFAPALRGINAAVVGILFAALVTPVWTSAVHAPIDVAIVIGAYVLLACAKWPPWSIVALCASAAQLMLAGI